MASCEFAAAVLLRDSRLSAEIDVIHVARLVESRKVAETTWKSDEQPLKKANTNENNK